MTNKCVSDQWVCFLTSPPRQSLDPAPEDGDSPTDCPEHGTAAIGGQGHGPIRVQVILDDPGPHIVSQLQSGGALLLYDDRGQHPLLNESEVIDKGCIEVKERHAIHCRFVKVEGERPLLHTLDKKMLIIKFEMLTSTNFNLTRKKKVGHSP